MKIKDIREAAHTQTPFTIKTDDGNSYKIPHVDFISFAPSKNWAVVSSARGGVTFLDAAKVTSIDYGYATSK